MLPCHKGCTYKRVIPWNSHVQCVHGWDDRPIPVGDERGVQSGWYAFPINFDPVWGPDECEGYRKIVKPEEGKRS